MWWVTCDKGPRHTVDEHGHLLSLTIRSQPVPLLGERQGVLSTASIRAYSIQECHRRKMLLKPHLARNPSVGDLVLIVGVDVKSRRPAGPVGWGVAGLALGQVESRRDAGLTREQSEGLVRVGSMGSRDRQADEHPQSPEEAGDLHDEKTEKRVKIKIPSLSECR